MGTYMVNNYTTAQTWYVWTGLNTQNQAWSYFSISDYMIVDQIQAHWGGHGASATGNHCIWNWTAGSGNILDGLVVKSSSITVPSGRGWRTADCTPTLLAPGSYAVGVWCDPADPREFSQYTGNGGSAIYMETTANTGPENTATADASDGTGAFPCAFKYEFPNRSRVYASGAWQLGETYVYAAGWKKASNVWVYAGGWKRGSY